MLVLCSLAAGQSSRSLAAGQSSRSLAAGQSSRAMLASVSFTETRPASGATRDFALRCADGTRIGSWSTTITPGSEGVRLAPDEGPVFRAPRLQRWLASPDGRTLVGIGDGEAAEHPFELCVLVHRDGRVVAELAEHLATESEFHVGRDGTLAIAGHRAGERGRPLALALDREGRVLYRHALPPDTLAREPVLFGTRMLVRVHGLRTEGVDGAILAIDESGAHELRDAPGALALLGFPRVERALVLTAGSATWIDAGDGHALWERALALRPAGENACELLQSPRGAVLGVVTARPQRAGEPRPAPELVLLDAGDGVLLERIPLRSAGPAADVDLEPLADGLALQWSGAREVLRWNE